MKQYLELSKAVKEKGTYKAPAREGMPGTTSLFGYQFRHDLSEGFPLLTTKKLSFKNIVVELLWFLRGDTNIKYLIDNGCNIWNEDAYNYLRKNTKKGEAIPTFEWFIELIKGGNDKLGDCGAQYGWLMRNLKSIDSKGNSIITDQIQDLIEGLKKSPLGRRHIINNWNVGTLDNMALNACHALVQFNCRPLTYDERNAIHIERFGETVEDFDARWEVNGTESYEGDLNNSKIPKYKLDCQMYQRSCDTFLGLGYNIASYALLTHILCKVCNMVPGDYIHSFGDVHIYDNHMAQIDEQLLRDVRVLPNLKFSDWFENSIKENHPEIDLNTWIDSLSIKDFIVENYNPHPTIKGKLSTGLQ